MRGKHHNHPQLEPVIDIPADAERVGGLCPRCREHELVDTGWVRTLGGDPWSRLGRYVRRAAGRAGLIVLACPHCGPGRLYWHPTLAVEATEIEEVAA